MGTASSPNMPLAQVYKITYRGPENHIQGLIRTMDSKYGYQNLFQNTDVTEDDLYDLRLTHCKKSTNSKKEAQLREPLYTYDVMLDGSRSCHADFGIEFYIFGIYSSMFRYGFSDSTTFQRQMWTRDEKHLFTVLYGVFEEAAEACVKVRLTKVNSDTDLYGTIYARTSAIKNSLYKRLLFFKDIGDPRAAMEPEVENGFLVSQSFVAVPLESDLILEICLSGGDNNEIVPNIEVFKCVKGAPPSHRRIACSNWVIEVDVLWRYEFLERTEAPEEKNPVSVSKTMTDSGIGGNFGKKMYCEKPIQIYERHKRDRDEYLEAPLSTHSIIHANFVRFAECIHKIKEKRIDDLTATIKNAARMNQLEEFENCTEELNDIITMYPKLSGYLEKDLLELLVGLLKDKQSSNLQSLAATILQSVFAHSSKRNMLIENIKSEIFLNLISSNLHVQALELLHSITFVNPGPELKAILEAVLERVTLLLSDEPTNQVLHSGSKALAAICRVYPELPPNKLETVLCGLVNLLKYKSLMEVRSYACSGFQYLCDGRQQMVVEDKYFKPLYKAIQNLTRLWNEKDNSHEIPVAAFAAMGSIVRCTDEFVKFMIDEGQLWLIKLALEEEQLYFVKNACWILSNITAGNTNYLKDSNYTELIGLLVRIVESYQYIEAKEEAMWALLNAIYGVGSDNEGLKKQIKQYSKPLWRTLKACRHHEQLAYLCLEGLVKLEGIEITCNDKPLGGADFQKILVELYGRFQAEGITNYNLTFRLTCTYEEEDAQQPLLLSYNGLVDKLPCVLLDSEERADPKQVKML